jgi:hypothetical protein
MAVAKRQTNVDGGRPVRKVVKMTVEDAARIEAAAEAADQSVPKFMTACTFSQMNVETDDDRQGLIFALGRVEYQLAKIGNNVNQIAYRLNATGTLEAGVAETLADVRKQMREVQNVARTVQRTRIS